MSFSVRFFPGVRLRVSSRGISASAGPRFARVSIGTGGMGLATGVGPVSVGTGVSTGLMRGGRRAGGGRSEGAKGGQRALERMERVERAFRDIDHILTLHRQSFPRITKPPYPTPRYLTVAEVNELRRRELKAAFRSVPLWRRAQRERVRAEVEALLAATMRSHDRRADEEAAAAREEIDAWWGGLLVGDPRVVLETVNRALSDNERPSAAVHVEGSELSIVFRVPSTDDIPDREVTETPSGQQTTKPLSKTRRNQLLSLAALGHMIATAKEALAMAPTIMTVKVVGVAERGPREFDVLLAGIYERRVLGAVDWSDPDPAAVFEASADAATVLLAEFGGRTSELQPLDLSDEPDLRELAATLAGAPREA